MKKKTILPLLTAMLLLPLPQLLSSCKGAPKQGRCDIEVYSPAGRYTEVRLLDTRGGVIDSTLTVKNDSIRFSRTDSVEMPYVATLRLRNPSDSLDIIYMPLVVEAGTVRLDLTDRISLSGTADNEALFRFLKAKNSFVQKYEREGNPEHDVQKLKRDYSEFFASQILLNKGTVVGDYLLEAYRGSLTPEDYDRVAERLRK